MSEKITMPDIEPIRAQSPKLAECFLKYRALAEEVKAKEEAYFALGRTANALGEKLKTARFFERQRLKSEAGRLMPKLRAAEVAAKRSKVDIEARIAALANELVAELESIISCCDTQAGSWLIQNCQPLLNETQISSLQNILNTKEPS